MVAEPARPRPQAAALLGWGLAVLIAACVQTLWSTYSLVTYDVGDKADTYFLVSGVGVVAVALTMAAVRQFLNSPGEGSRQLQVGRKLLTAGAVATVIAVGWLMVVARS